MDPIVQHESDISNNSNVLVVSLSTTWPNQFAIEVEYVHQQLAAGNKVDVLACVGGVERCLAKLDGNEWHCNACIHRREVVYDRFAAHPNFRMLPMQFSPQQTPECIHTLDDVESFHLDGFRLGLSAMSSGIFKFRDFPLHPLSFELAKAFLRSSITVYSGVSMHLANNLAYGNALVFNGRFADVYGALCAVRRKVRNYTLYESAGAENKYVLYHDGSPHSVVSQTGRVRLQLKRLLSDSSLEASGHEFFTNKRLGNVTNDVAYIKSDFVGFELPAEFKGRKVVSIFNSSEDECNYTEYSAEYRADWYHNQCDGIRQIATALLNHDEFVVVLRVHPNLAGGNPEELRELLSLNVANLVIISPTERISSYSLIDASSSVITFYSTIGVEAAYWGKPSVSLCATPASNIGATHYASSLQDLLRIIINDPIATDRLLCVAFGATLLGGDTTTLTRGTWPVYWMGSLCISNLGNSPLESCWFLKLRRRGLNVKFASMLSKPLRLLTFIKQKVSVLRQVSVND